MPAVPEPGTPAAPMFTIVVPVHDRPGTIGRAVRSCLAQGFADFELLVVDDGSAVPVRDALADIDDARLRCLRLPVNAGVSNARNVGIEAAAGRYVAFLDSDDEFTADKLEVCHAALARAGYPDDLCLGSRIDIERPSGFRATIPGALIGPGEGVLDYLFVRGGILSTDVLVVSAPLARRARFRTDLTRHEDYDYVWQLERAGARFVMLPESLAVWHDDDLPDRLTRSTGYAESRAWIDSIAGRVPGDVLAACRLRVLGPLAARERRFAGLALYARNVAAATTMRASSKAVCLLKCAAPRTYTRLTSLWVRLEGRAAPDRQPGRGTDRRTVAP